VQPLNTTHEVFKEVVELRTSMLLFRAEKLLLDGLDAVFVRAATSAALIRLLILFTLWCACTVVIRVLQEDVGHLGGGLLFLGARRLRQAGYCLL
jgi:hypothetical protein